MSRRRSRHWHPDVLEALREELDTGASAPGVLDKLYKRQEVGELRDKDDQELPLPSIRSIQDIAREWKRDDSGAWQLTDSPAAEVLVVLRALAAVVKETEGRIQSLTKREAEVIPRLAAITGGQIEPYTLYRLARFYVYWRAREGDDRGLVLFFAFLSDQERLRTLIAEGWVTDLAIIAEIGKWSSANAD